MRELNTTATNANIGDMANIIQTHSTAPTTEMAQW